MAKHKGLLDFISKLNPQKNSFSLSEVALAKEIQTHLFPKNFPFKEKLDIGIVYQPAEHLGGDFYDVIKIDDRKAAFLIGDISGHSIAAALFMTQCLTLLKTLIKMDLSLLKIATTANQFLFEGAKSNMFATVFIGIFDSFYNQLSYVNAGHPPPFLIRSAWGRSVGGIVPISNLTAEGMALNCVKKLVLEEKKLQLVTHDILFLYTDGLIEFLDQNNHPIGESTLKHLLNEWKELEASEIAKKLVSYLQNNTQKNEQTQDDTTALIIKFKEQL